MKIEVTCAECGKKEYVNPSRAKKYLCCSTKCLGKHNSKKYNKKVKLICPICGSEYECKQSKINNHKTCGKKECRSEWLKKTKTGKSNSNYKLPSLDLLDPIKKEKKANTSDFLSKTKVALEKVLADFHL